MAINRGFRIPDGLILCYPALSLSKLRFTPSILLSVDDQLLPYPFLNMCLDSYVGNYKKGDKMCDPDIQEYLSPNLAGDE
jgi:hormone-sensitive lipase